MFSQEINRSSKFQLNELCQTEFVTEGMTVISFEGGDDKKDVENIILKPAMPGFVRSVARFTVLWANESINIIKFYAVDTQA